MTRLTPPHILLSIVVVAASAAFTIAVLQAVQMVTQ